MANADIPVLLPSAPNVPVPAIWGYLDTVAYTPAETWNQALILRVNNYHAHASSTGAALLLTLLLFVCLLSRLIGKCYYPSQNHAAAAPRTDGDVPPKMTCDPMPPNPRKHTGPVWLKSSFFAQLEERENESPPHLLQVSKFHQQAIPFYDRHCHPKSLCSFVKSIRRCELSSEGFETQATTLNLMHETTSLDNSTHLQFGTAL